MSHATRPCEICMKPIEAERLETLPETRLCLEHAEKIAKYGGEFTMSLSWEKTSKQGGLKKNYGGVTPHKRRNQQALERLKDEFEDETGEGPNLRATAALKKGQPVSRAVAATSTRDRILVLKAENYFAKLRTKLP